MRPLDVLPSIISKVKETLQIFMNMPEITNKFEKDNGLKHFTETVKNILDKEISFILKSELKRSCEQ